VVGGRWSVKNKKKIRRAAVVITIAGLTATSFCTPTPTTDDLILPAFTGHRPPAAGHYFCNIPVTSVR